MPEIQRPLLAAHHPAVLSERGIIRIPEGTPNPIYRVQFETTRVPVEERRILCVVLSAEPEAMKIDPEQLLLSPIFDDGHRLIFEFRRAHILSVSRRGDLETRLVAVDPARGVIGTKTIHRFDTRLLALASRCVEHLSGAIDLFPARDRASFMQRVQIPIGEANLSFGSPGRLRPQPPASAPKSALEVPAVHPRCPGPERAACSDTPTRRPAETDPRSAPQPARASPRRASRCLP